MPTPEQLAKIQKLIDMGASDEDIQTVVDHFKAQANVKPIDANEPDTYLGGFFKGAGEGMLGGAKGFVKGLPGGVASLATELPRQIVDAGVGAIKGAANFVNDPSKTMANAKAGASTAMSKIPEMAQALMDMAATDPEGFGKAVGHLTGNAEGMIALGAAMPLLPRPIALKVGQTLEKVGKTGEFAAYLTGAHQIASGKPEGVVTMLVPGAMRAASSPLIRFGSKGTPAGMVTPLAEEIGSSVRPKPAGAVREPYNVPVVESAAEAAKRMQQTSFNEQPLHAQMDDLPVGADAPAPPQPNPFRFREPPVREPAPVEAGSAPVASGVDRAMLKKQGYSDEMIATLEAADAASRQPAAPRKLPRLTSPEPAPAPPVRRTAGDLYREQGRTIPTNEGMPEEFQRSQYGDLPNRSDPGQDQLFGRERIGGPDTSDAAFNARAKGDYVPGDQPEFERLMAETAVPEDFTAEGQMTPDPLNPPPGPAVDVRAQARPKATDLPPDLEATGEAIYDPSNPPPGPTVGDAKAMGTPQTSFEEMMAAAEPPAAQPVPEPVAAAPVEDAAPAPKPNTTYEDAMADMVPEENLGTGSINLEGPNVVPDVPVEARPVAPEPQATTPKPRKILLEDAGIASKSKRGKSMMSSTPGLTIADMKAIGMKPNIKLTHVTQEMIDAILAARKARSSTYRTNAGLDKGFDEATGRDRWQADTQGAGGSPVNPVTMERVPRPTRAADVPVYHGSAEMARQGGFNGKLRLDLDPSGRARTPGDNPDSLGTWWTGSKADAAHYGQSYDVDAAGQTVKKPGHILEGSVSLENPKVFESAEEWTKYVNGFRKKTESGRTVPNGSAMKADLQKAGHDGFIVRGGGKGDATPEGGDFYLSFDNKGVKVKTPGAFEKGLSDLDRGEE